MKTFNLILSHALRVILLFLLSFIWLRFYEKNLWLVVLYSTLITIALDLVLNLLIKKKENYHSLQNEELQKAKGYANYFIFNDKSVAINFFKKLFSAQFEVNAKTHYLFWTKDENTTVFIPLFTYDNIKIGDIISAYNSIKPANKPTQVIICGASFDKETVAFAKSLPIKIVLFNQFDCYQKLMKPTNTFPKQTFEFKPQKTSTLSIIFQYAFNRKRTKAWLFSSFLLIFASFFVKVSIYYLVISSVMLIFAIISLCNKKYNNLSLPENIF